jgi:hypothetical protein
MHIIDPTNRLANCRRAIGGGADELITRSIGKFGALTRSSALRIVPRRPRLYRLCRECDEACFDRCLLSGATPEMIRNLSTRRSWRGTTIFRQLGAGALQVFVVDADRMNGLTTASTSASSLGSRPTAETSQLFVGDLSAEPREHPAATDDECMAWAASHRPHSTALASSRAAPGSRSPTRTRVTDCEHLEDQELPPAGFEPALQP